MTSGKSVNKRQKFTNGRPPRTPRRPHDLRTVRYAVIACRVSSFAAARHERAKVPLGTELPPSITISRAVLNRKTSPRVFLSLRFPKPSSTNYSGNWNNKPLVILTFE